jgi:hypothetical protein
LNGRGSGNDCFHDDSKDVPKLRVPDSYETCGHWADRAAGAQEGSALGAPPVVIKCKVYDSFVTVTIPRWRIRPESPLGEGY